MEQTRPWGYPRGRLQVATNQQGWPRISRGVRGPRPIHSTQLLQTPITGVAMQRRPSHILSRAACAPQHRALRPVGPTPEVPSDKSVTPVQGPMVQQVTEGLTTLGEGNTLVRMGIGRGRRKVDLEHFTTPRPRSSLGNIEKQDSNKDLVVKEINNLRSSARKEKKKSEASLKSGGSADDVYRPELFYYEMMSFVDDQDTPRESTSNLDIQDESISEIGIDDNQENEVEGILSNKIQNSTVARSDAVNPPRAEKSKKNDAKLSTEVLLSVRDHFKSPKIEEDRHDVIAKGYAIRLRELEKSQRIIAEKLINDIFFEAEMGSLTLNYKLTTAAETT